jgi:bifunctional pyridoxal-dependent enzyme with beta-cystathionase and maltose regulon repressor activities
MDFKTASEIIEAIQKKVETGILGYTIVPDAWYHAIINWWERRHHFQIDKEWLIFCTGVVPAISSAVRKMTSVGENVLVQTPVYNIFFNSIVNNGRNMRKKQYNLYCTNKSLQYSRCAVCSRITEDTASLCQFLLSKTGVYVSSGESYGETGKGFIRINAACPRERLEDGLTRLKKESNYMKRFDVPIIIKAVIKYINNQNLKTVYTNARLIKKIRDIHTYAHVNGVKTNRVTIEK